MNNGLIHIASIALIFISCSNNDVEKEERSNDNNYRNFKVLETTSYKHLSNNEIDSAIYYCNLAIKNVTNHDHDKLIRIYSILSASYFEKNQLNRCISLNKKINNISLNSSFDLIRNFHWTTANIMTSNCYRLLGKYDSALYYIGILEQMYSQQYSKKSLSPDHELNADIQTWKALILSNKGDYDLSISSNLKAIESLKYSDTTNCIIANNYSHIGSVFVLKKDYIKAEKYFLKALKIINECYGKESLFYADNLTELGLLYYESKNYLKALDCFENTQRIIKNHYSTGEIEFAYSYNNLGDANCNLGNFIEGIKYYLLALKIFQDFNAKEEICVVYHNLGNAFNQCEKYDTALLYYNKSLKLAITTRKKNSLFTAYTYQRLGELHDKIKKYQKSISYYENAINELSYFKNDSSLYSNNFLQNGILSQPVILDCLQSKGLAHYNIYKSNLDKKNLEFALNSLDKAFQVLDIIETSYTTEDSKLELRKVRNSLINNYLSVIILQNKYNSNHEVDNKIFELIERNKFSSLKSLLQSAKRYSSVEIPKKVYSKIDSLNKKIRYYEKILNIDYQNKISNSENLIGDSLFFNIYTLDTIYNYLLYNHSNINKTQLIANHYTIEEAQKMLSDSTGIIEYFYSDSLLILLAMNKTSHFIHIEKLKDEFQQMLNIFKKSILFSDLYNLAISARYLYKKLIEPVFPIISHMNSVLIVPDNYLATIPFEALLKPSEDGECLQSSYLINDFDISYQYSLYLWILNNKKQRTANNWEYEFAGFAPVNFNSSDFSQNIYSNLPSSKNEVETIAKYFNKYKLPAKSFLNNYSNEYSLVEFLQKSKIVHIASHSMMHIEPSKYHILLTNPKNIINTNSPIYMNNCFINVTDGRLSLAEIFNLKVNADLVAINSCYSGSGNIITSEGKQSLALAFYYAGASNVLYTMHKVSDKHSNIFMTYFYSYLLRGFSYKRALRKTKIDFINTSYQLPIYWSGYLING